MRNLAPILWASVLSLQSLLAQPGAEIRGTTLDGRTGQALSMVDVRLSSRTYVTRSDATGHFAITGLARGDYLLEASTVGYRMIVTEVHLDREDVREFQLILTPDGFDRVDSVTVHSGSVFDPAGDNSGDPFRLAGTDLKNLGTVLADDPLRAVQAAPLT